MRLAIQPVATIFLIASFKDAITILASIFIVAFVTFAVWPHKLSESVHFSIFPVSLVLPLIRPDVCAFAVEFSVLKLTSITLLPMLFTEFQIVLVADAIKFFLGISLR